MPIPFPAVLQRQDDARSDFIEASYVSEARDSKAFVRERMKFRLAQATGLEVIEPQWTPITPVSGAAIQAVGNPLDEFLLEQLGEQLGIASDRNHLGQ